MPILKTQWTNKEKTDHHKEGYCEDMKTIGSCYGCIYLEIENLRAKCLRDGKTKGQKDIERDHINALRINSGRQ